MKKLIFTLVLVPIIGFGQGPSNEELNKAMNQWVFFSGGNPIDGFSRDAIRFNSEQEVEENMFLLKVESSAETVEIENSMGEDNNDRDNILIELRTFGTFDYIDEVYMYFDNEKIFYRVNFRQYGSGSNGMILWNAVGNNDEEFLTRFNIIQKLKVKNNLFLRFIYKDAIKDEKQINISFDLEGSSKALNQVFTMPYVDDKDYYMDMISGVTRKAQFCATTELNAYLDNLVIDSLITHFLDSTVSTYHNCFIFDYKLVNGSVFAYNLNDDFVVRIPYDYFNHNNRIVNKILETLYSSAYCQNTFSNFEEFVNQLKQNYRVILMEIKNSLPDDIFDDDFTFYDYTHPLKNWYNN